MSELLPCMSTVALFLTRRLRKPASRLNSDLWFDLSELLQHRHWNTNLLRMLRMFIYDIGSRFLSPLSALAYLFKLLKLCDAEGVVEMDSRGRVLQNGRISVEKKT